MDAICTDGLVSEVAHAGGEACHVVFVAEVEGFLVAFAAAWVCDQSDACIHEQFGTIAEREKCVGVGDASFCKRTGFVDCEFATGDAIHLAGTAAEHSQGVRAVAGDVGTAENDGVAEKESACGFEKTHGVELCGGGGWSGAVCEGRCCCEGEVAILHENAAGNGAEFEFRGVVWS